MGKPKLTIMVGIPGAGKSSIVERWQEQNKNLMVVANDKIRAELSSETDQSQNDKVFRIFHKRIKEALLSGKSVVADATNIKLKSRKAILECAKGIDCHKVAYIVATTFETCLKRNAERERSVPESVLYKMRSQFEVPFYEEGYDEITYFRNVQEEDLISVNEGLLKMNGFDQKNPHHKYHLGAHCWKAYDEFSKYCPDEGFGYGAQLHDWGKQITQTFDENGVAHYYQHHNVGAYEVLTKFNISWKFMLDAVFLINYHMFFFNIKNEKTELKYRKLFGTWKYEVVNTFHMCDKLASGTQEVVY